MNRARGVAGLTVAVDETVMAGENASGGSEENAAIAQN